MSDPQNKAGAIFDAAVELPRGMRAAYLQEACGDDEVLRLRVEALLGAHDSAGTFMGRPAVSPQRETLPAGPAEKVGDHIGRYKLLQQIGEGGCGVVYMAEQEEPVRRQVALKVIKLGMDTKQVIARFEAERQALALMDHPNIAKVLDAGATETGRPYFVMELVRGIKITDYCDQNHLSTQERLDLFIKVCQAIQHAHQKGVIHRDIKPSNLLVTMNDGVPLPKVIDFGIAKATHGKLTDKTLFTAFEQFIGTPAYMSPEQSEMSALDIDTRSDIYSLGVLLYELLTGRTPFDAQKLLQAGLDEIRRTIREEEPAKPSTCLSTMLGADLTEIAKHRKTEPPNLIHLVRGDLDWIVIKSLEKDRARRYETANGLAADIQRHLNKEPVVACPPSNVYKFQKLVRRNKLIFVAVSAVITALVVGFGISTWMFYRERAARYLATEAQRKAEAGQTALLYWQAFDALPQLSQIESNTLVNADAMNAEQTAALMARYDRTFLLLNRAADMKFGCDWAANPSEDGPETWFVRWSKLRQIPQVARLRAHNALLQGDPDSACQDLLATFILGRQVATDGTLTEVMSLVAIESQTVEFVAQNYYLFPSQNIAALERAIENAPPHVNIGRSLEWETATVSDWFVRKIQNIQQAAAGDEGKALAGVHALLVADWNQKQADEIIVAAGGTTDGVLELARQSRPFFGAIGNTATASPDKLAAETARATRLVETTSNVLARLAAPSFSKARTQEIEALCRIAMLKAAVAYRLHGLSGFRNVADPFGNAPFEFHQLERGFELHSAIERFGFSGSLTFVEHENPH